MNIQLNLLPSAQKKILQSRRIFRRALEQELYVVIIASIFCVGLFGIHLVLAAQNSGVHDLVEQQKSDQNYKKITQAQELFRDVNKQIQSLYVINDRHIAWSPALRLLSGAVDSGVRVDQITTRDTTITVRATAKTRSDAVAFKKRLSDITKDDSVCFHNITIPAEDLVVERLTSFTVEMNVAQHCVALGGDLSRGTVTEITTIEEVQDPIADVVSEAIEEDSSTEDTL